MGWREMLSSVRNAFKWWVVIAPWERALRVRLGKNVTLLEAGVHLRIPSVDRIFVQPIRVRTTDIGVQTVTTRDGETVTVAGNVQYRVENLHRLYETLHDGAATVIDLAAARVAQYISTREIDELNPDQLAEAVTEGLGLDQYGLGEASVNITDFCVVRTYRLIQDNRQYREGGWFDMTEKHASE